MLKWDFRTTFPSPLGTAVDAGVLGDADLDPDQVQALHEELAAEAISVLADLDAVLDAQRRGVDPRTRKPPRTEKARQTLTRSLAFAPHQLRQTFDALLSSYQDAFGDEAARAFRSACLAWSRGHDVIAEPTVATIAPTMESQTLEDGLPLSTPLPSAIAQRAFGSEEDGTEVRPSWEEIEAVTRRTADRLLEMLPDHPADYSALLARYAEDFGGGAAEGLDQFVRGQAEQDGENSWDGGHPWHYYERGDHCSPVPLERIAPDAEAGRRCIADLPKNAKARRSRLATMLAEQQRQLDEDRRRYVELTERGVDALSEYDRTIAANGDEHLAWATAISLKYRHIRAGLGRVAVLRKLMVPNRGTA